MKDELDHHIQEIIKKNELLTNSLNALDEWIDIIDENGHIVFMSEGSKKLLNLGIKDVSGKPVTDVWSFHHTKDNLFMLKAIQYGIPFENKYVTLTSADGNAVNAVTSIYPVFANGKVIGSIGSTKDIAKVKSDAKKVVNLQKEVYFNRLKQNKNGTQFNFEDIIGTSQIMQSTIKTAQKFAANMSPVLIIGETGTGKELFAQSIHNNSPVGQGPFVAINCSAIPETLLESILFGTTRGAFTGAEEKRGLFEEAEDGTLFLDEINSMSMLLQAKLLRVLQDKTIRRIGSNKEISVNPRIISAMNTDPYEAVEKGQLRSDLFYRLAVVTLELPTLRKRPEDLEPLVEHFIQDYNRIMGKSVETISQKVQKMFKEYNWPGNIRELKHVIEHAMNVAEETDTILTPTHLPPHIQHTLKKHHSFSLNYKNQTLKETMLSLEKEVISRVLIENNGNVTQTAKQLDLSRQHLHKRIKQLDINPGPRHTD